MQIAIDGPAAAGKSSVSRRLAEKLGFLYIDTGAMYRALTLLAIRKGVDCGNEEGLMELLDEHEIRLEGREVLIDNENVTQSIRGKSVTALVSHCCAPRNVRQRMVELQRKMADRVDSVMEGRDIGTVVLPRAELKIFMTASSPERARRRKNDPSNPELREVDLDSIEKDIARRDELDSTREVAPLKPGPDSIHMDTTGMSIEEVTDRIIEMLNTKHKPKTPRST